MRVFFGIFGAVFLAELGDKTQIATLLFASKNGVNKLTVFLAAASALVCTSLIAVLFGDYFSKVIPPHLIKTIAGIIFILLGIFMLTDII